MTNVTVNSAIMLVLASLVPAPLMGLKDVSLTPFCNYRSEYIWSKFSTCLKSCAVKRSILYAHI